MEEELIAIGLTSGEARVYTALLKLGPSTVGPISYNSKVSYSKIYDVLNRLANKGIVTITKKEKTRFYQAINPSRILDIIKKQEAELENKKEKLEKILPDLIRLEQANKRNDEAEIFKGIKGIQTAYEIFLEETPKKEDIYFFYTYKKKHEDLVDEFYWKIFPKFKEFGHNWKGVCTKEYQTSIKKQPHFVKFKIVNFPIPGNIDISNYMILVTIWSEEPTAILIRSKEVAQNYRDYFESVWKKGKET